MIRIAGQALRFAALCLVVHALSAHAADWIRQGVNTNLPVWGIPDGLLFALHPGGFGGTEGGPRGLIRIGYPTLTNGGCDLINFIAVEPVVQGHRAFSELEPSSRDRRAGKLFEAITPSGILTTNQGVEQLEVRLAIERFENGAHVGLKLQQRNDAPGELRLVIETLPDSATMDCCILTATMGNKARTRLLWLRDGPVSSLDQYRQFRGTDFAPHRVDGLARLPRLPDGDVRVCVTTDEEVPSKAQPFGRPHFWDYRGRKVTQYWRKPAGTVLDDLHCAVNGRCTYYGTDQAIPGGVAFENFELRQRFREGDVFIFGLTSEEPRSTLR